jgi:hypothetical protein
VSRHSSPNRPKRPGQPPQTQKAGRRQPQGDRRPIWWQSIASYLDLPGRLAERLEARWQRWWVPLILLSFPILLLLLAFVVSSLR